MYSVIVLSVSYYSITYYIIYIEIYTASFIVQDYDYIVYVLKKLPEFHTQDENDLRSVRLSVHMCMHRYPSCIKYNNRGNSLIVIK